MSIPFIAESSSEVMRDQAVAFWMYLDSPHIVNQLEGEDRFRAAERFGLQLRTARDSFGITAENIADRLEKQAHTEVSAWMETGQDPLLYGRNRIIELVRNPRNEKYSIGPA